MFSDVFPLSLASLITLWLSLRSHSNRQPNKTCHHLELESEFEHFWQLNKIYNKGHINFLDIYYPQKIYLM